MRTTDSWDICPKVLSYAGRLPFSHGRQANMATWAAPFVMDALDNIPFIK